jgi:hypothetical protein
MANRRKPKMPLQPLLITDNRDQPDEKWIPVAQLPPDKHHGMSDRMIVCQRVVPGRANLILASYCFHRHQWRTAMGAAENVTHWQPLPETPKEYQI